MVQEQAPVLQVDPVQGDDRATGEPLKPLKTLTAALKRAAVGTVIRLNSGKYSAENGEVFPLRVPAGVTVIGAIPQRGKDILIVGGSVLSTSTFGPQSVALVLETGAQIRGVTITNPAPKGSGIWLESTDPIIANCTLCHCGREGIFVTGTAHPTIANCLFQANRASGIAWVRYAKGEVRRSIFQANGRGMVLSDCAAPFIVENQLIDNQMGLLISGQACPVLRGNRIERNAKAGLVLMDQAQLDFGHRQEGAANLFHSNGDWDLQNQTAFPLLSVGNQLSPARVSGQVELGRLQATTIPAQPVFPVTAARDWTEPFVQALRDNQILPQVTQSTLKKWLLQTPDAPLSRADYAALVGHVFLSADPTSADPIEGNADEDVWSEDIRGEENLWNEDIWSEDIKGEDRNEKDAIAQATTHGFLCPLSETCFSAAAPLTRLEVMAGLATGLSLPAGRLESLQVYRDAAQIPSQWVGRVAAATQHRLVVLFPQPDRFNPLQPITQAEAAASIYQALVLQEKATAIASPYWIDPHQRHQHQCHQPQPRAANLPGIVVLEPACIQRTQAVGLLSQFSDVSSMHPADPEAASEWQADEIVQAIAQEVASLLQFQGIETWMKLSPDQAERSGADLYLRLQIDSTDPVDPQHNGMAVFSLSDTVESAQLAQLLHKVILRRLDTRSLGVHLPEEEPQPPLPSQTATASVRLTLGFMTGQEDRVNLQNVEYRRAMARAIVEAIQQYLSR